MVALDYRGIAEGYVAAWAERDDARRRALIERVWAERGEYLTPTTDLLVGPDALTRHIGAFYQRFPGHRILLTSSVDGHHDHLRYNWAMVSPEGKTLLEGQDVAWIGAAGKIQRLTEFFGPLPPLEST
ncbi:MAG TPA: hypothetical protein VF808_11150 [Ktedonobacterales bacterium]